LLGAAREAAEIVMRVYAQADVGMELKGPNDPVTRADKEANALLLDRLSRALPGVPIVAEESDPSTFQGFGAAPRALFVDPVDGTREFIAKNGEFAVMIGYAEGGAAVVGVVVCPALGAAGLTYAGIAGEGAFVVDEATGAKRALHVSGLTALEDARCAVSRFHRSKTVDARLRALGVRELVPTGSAGVKGVRVASAELDLYAHPSRGPVKLWDACAPDAIVRAAGGLFTDGTGRPFDYRGPLAQGNGMLAGSPALHAEAVRRMLAASVPDAQDGGA
jgi:3'(2'), 5'-bisphosphate nucleotidase